MKAPNSDDWLDLPERMNCFTVRNAAMYNLNTGKIVQYYSANTKIAVVQKCVTTEGTFYRTAEAAHHYLNYAFKASAFGLPDEKAPSAPSNKPDSLNTNQEPDSRTLLTPAKKQKSSQKVVSPNDGGVEQAKNFLKKILSKFKK